MQNSVNFPWVNPSNFTSNSSNSNKNVWQDYQNLAADFLLKNQNLKNQNIYSPSISQLAHSNYLEKMSNLAANSNDMQLNSNQSQSQLPDLNDLNSLSGLNEKWNQLPNSGHLMLSNTSAANLQSNHSSKHHSNGLAESSNLHSNSFSNHNGNSTHHSTSGSGRKCLNKGNFLCVVCNKSFTQKGNLKTHQLIHTGTKPFICTVCGKGFTQKGNVDTHMRIHNGQKKIKKIKQKDFMNKDINRRDDFKFNQIQRHKDNNQDLNMNQNQSVIDRLLPIQSLNNTNSPINFSNSHHNSTASTPNWSNLANNLINNSAINKTNRNSSSSSTSNFQSSYDEFANNLSNYNTFTQMNSTHNLHHKLLEQLNNQNGKNSPIQNSMQQQQIDYNGIDFPLLQ